MAFLLANKLADGMTLGSVQLMSLIRQVGMGWRAAGRPGRRKKGSGVGGGWQRVRAAGSAGRVAGNAGSGVGGGQRREGTGVCAVRC